MRIEMKMPDLSTASDTVKVVDWLAGPGQDIKRGQVLLRVETDKATMDVEAYLSGTLVEIVAPPQTEVAVGQVIAWVESLEAPLNPSDVTSRQAASATPPPAAPAAEGPKPRGMFSRNRQKAAETPVQAALPVSMNSNQQVVGRRMLESKQTVPHFYLQTSANAGPMADRRKQAATEPPAWDAFFACAAARALKRFERMRYRFQEGRLAPPADEAIGIAIDQDGDLFVVPIQHADTRTPEAISSEIRQWASRLRAGDPEARKIHQTCFTISNLGATGVEAFTAIINPPEAAILAIGKVMPVAAVVDGQVTVQQRVNLTLSVDHRVANGRYAAEFLQCIVAELEAF